VPRALAGFVAHWRGSKWYRTSAFAPKRTSNAHVTIGLASQDHLKKMLDEKFEAFTFSPAKASVYHLGNFGTARKLLKSWEL
jgi:hypothetical protein